MKDIHNLFKKLGTDAVYQECSSERQQAAAERWALMREVPKLQAYLDGSTGEATRAKAPLTPVQPTCHPTLPASASAILPAAPVSMGTLKSLFSTPSAEVMVQSSAGSVKVQLRPAHLKVGGLPKAKRP